MKIRIREVIEINDGCALVNPKRKGTEVTSDFSCNEGTELEQFDKAATHLKKTISEQLSNYRTRIKTRLENEK